MKALIVAVDFSDNALYAARYALGLAKQLNADILKLYHSSVDGYDDKIVAYVKLEDIKETLVVDSEGLDISCIVDDRSLTDGLIALADRYEEPLIVMGITGRGKVGQRLVGSQVFKVTKHVHAPVLIVPENAVFTTIENTAVALPIIPDLRDYVPHNAIRSMVGELGASLMIVNVGGRQDKTPKPVLYAGLADMFEMFDDLSPTYHFFTSAKTTDTIIDFVENSQVQLLMSIAGQYGFLEGMFRHSMTKELAYHATVPLLIFRSGKP